MKSGIHPDLHKVKIICACGAEFDSESTKPGDVVKVDICSKCHPYYSGKQKVVDTSGRVEKFNAKLTKKK